MSSDVEIFGKLLHADGAGRHVALAEAAQVGSDHPIADRKRRDLGVPQRMVERKTVHQQQRRPVPFVEHFEPGVGNADRFHAATLVLRSHHSRQTHWPTSAATSSQLATATVHGLWRNSLRPVRSRQSCMARKGI